MKILVINGPNLSLLGKREPEIYGNLSLDLIYQDLECEAKKLDKNIVFSFFQSDIEGEIVAKIGDAWTNEKISGILLNPGAYTHTSIAIHDAIKACGLPVVEIHLSHIFRREDFRHTSIISSACVGQISGFGGYSYILGFYALVNVLSQIKKD